MPLVNLDFSPSLLSRFNLPEKFDERHPYSYKDLLISERSNVLLFRRSHFDCGEWLTDTRLIINGKTLIVIIQDFPKSNGKRRNNSSFIIRLQAFVPLSKNDLSKIRRITKQIPTSYFGSQENTLIAFNVEDETRPKKPRSIRKMREFMNKFASRIERNSLLNAMDMFVPMVVSADEAKLFFEYIKVSSGKGLTDKALLLFALGFEKCKKKLLYSVAFHISV